jgi:hypothetical protein
MMRGEAGGALITTEMLEANGLRVIDQGTQQAVTLREMADLAGLLRGHPNVYELFKTAVGGDDAEGTVFSPDQLDRRIDDASENRRQVEFLNHRLTRTQ